VLFLPLDYVILFMGKEACLVCWFLWFFYGGATVQLLGQSAVTFNITPATLCHLLFLVSCMYYLYFGISLV